MEEVDHIIIHSLKQINCDIDDAVETLKEFSTDLVIEATVKCLRLVNPNLEISSRLPPSMSARFRLGSSLAQICTDLGYQGEIGYQTFLYSGEADIRRVFMFLLEKLPKESEKSVSEPLGRAALLNKTISEEITRQLNLPWIPRFCKNQGLRWRGNTWSREGTSYMRPFSSCFVSYPRGLEDLATKLPIDLRSFYRDHQCQISKQVPNSSQITPSILEDNASRISAAHEWDNEWNQMGLATRLSEQEYKARKKQKLQKKIASLIQQEIQKDSFDTSNAFIKPFSADDSNVMSKNSRLLQTERLQSKTDSVIDDADTPSSDQSPVKTEEQIRAEELKQLENKLHEISEQLDMLQINEKKFTAGIQNVDEQLTKQDEQSKELKDLHRVKKQTYDLLPDADGNMKKLQLAIETSSQRLVNLANQWETHREPLIDQYRQLKETNANKISETQRKLDEIKNLREKIKELGDNSRMKEELHKQLLADYEKNAKDVNRAAYTRRILEIVANISKQKLAIDKVLIDTKEVQKEINLLTGKLDRTFTVTDELIFRDAKKDEAVRKAYKYLAALHENCSLLIKTVEETGAITREIRDLEDQIDNESQKKVQENLERIMADYKQMKQENAALIGKLKDNGNS